MWEARFIVLLQPETSISTCRWDYQFEECEIDWGVIVTFTCRLFTHLRLTEFLNSILDYVFFNWVHVGSLCISAVSKVGKNCTTDHEDDQFFRKWRNAAASWIINKVSVHSCVPSNSCRSFFEGKYVFAKLSGGDCKKVTVPRIPSSHTEQPSTLQSEQFSNLCVPVEPSQQHNQMQEHLYCRMF